MADLKNITTSVSDLARVLEKTSGSITEAEAGLLISGFVFEKFGRTLRQFDYRESFPAERPECRATFTRTFEHEDWIDGESVVQAGVTPTEAGFNERFHRIESDLDALGQAVQQTSDCLADMRKSLRTLLDELRAQINQIHSDIHDLSPDRRPATKVPPFLGLIEQSKFQGTVTLAGKQGSVWETSAGIVVLPDVTGGLGPRVLPDVRRNDGVVLGQFFAERPDIQKKFDGGKPVTKDMLVTDFGDDLLPDGRPLRVVLDSVTTVTSFDTPDALVDVVAREEANKVRLMPEGSEVIATSFKEGAAIDRVADAPLSDAVFIAPQIRDALVGSGVTSVGELATLGAVGIAKRLEKANVSVTSREAAEAVAAAGFLVHLR
jgi:hypothetical protein